jgi:hypothetical protein
MEIQGAMSSLIISDLKQAGRAGTTIEVGRTNKTGATGAIDLEYNTRARS